MPFHVRGEIRYFQFGLFDQGVTHAVFSRQGGVSPEPWASLNLGSTVGDDIERVRENRRLALNAMELTTDSIFDVWQVHGVEVAITESPHLPESQHKQADTILTDKPGLILMMRFADCVPIMFHDPVRKVVGISHAGWMGTVRGAVSIAVEAMQTNFGSKPEDILATIGPSIGPDHYEVGPDVIAQVRQAFGKEASSLVSTGTNSYQFNLWEANRYLLEKAGVRHIEIAGLCTACFIEDWYSHRAEKGRTGRFGAIIGLV